MRWNIARKAADIHHLRGRIMAVACPQRGVCTRWFRQEGAKLPPGLPLPGIRMTLGPTPRGEGCHLRGVIARRMPHLAPSRAFNAGQISH